VRYVARVVVTPAFLTYGTHVQAAKEEEEEEEVEEE
jgi:sirohydrochlorin ferrochelatase